MSFILDALRKSETERQKAQVPGIADAPLVVHRNRVPRWTVGVIAGLSGCLAVLVWVWQRDAGSGAEPEALGVTVESSAQFTPAAPIVTSAARQDGEVRDLSAEARQATVAPVGEERPAVPAAAPLPPVLDVVATPLRTLAQYRASGGGLPELNLELHVYSPAAADRFVFINSAKYVEGETMAEGPRLVAITEEGAVLTHQGQSLLLPRE